MTGIAHASNNIIDSPESRYHKYKITSERYRIIQLGIVTWRFMNDTKTKIESKPYNIYVFPSEDGPLNTELGAMIFNRDHGLDFNKWIYKGIYTLLMLLFLGVDYINEKKYRSMYQNVIEENINCYDPNEIGKYKHSIPYKNEDVEKCNGIIKEIEQYCQSKDEEYVIEKIPKFMLYYVMNKLTEEQRQGLYFINSTLNGKAVIYMKKVNKELRQEMLTKEIEGLLTDLERAKGVKRIYDAILKRKSILIGHNSSLDLLFLISHFGEQLPQSYKDFKSTLKTYFNGVYDTKLMYEHLQTEKTVLSDNTFSTLEKMYPQLKALYSNQIEIIIPENMINYLQMTNYHDASYDAFVTGAIFIWISIGLKNNTDSFCNKIYFMKSIFNSFDLTKNEEYIVKDSKAYFLKAARKSSDIDLNRVFDNVNFIKIKKIFSAEMFNTIIILVKLDSDSDRITFENIMQKSKQMFTYYTYDAYQEMVIKEEKMKKANGNKNNNYNK